MSAWSELRQATLLGTRRTPQLDSDSDPHLQQLLKQLDGQNLPHDLLSMAGTIALYDQVGQLPTFVHSGTAVAPPPTENRAHCNYQTTHHLLQMLDGTLRTLLPEFLTALATANRNVPPTILPNLLAHGAKFSTQRPQIIAVIGRYGRWLATQNPDWAYATAHLETWSGLNQHWAQLTMPKQQTLLRQIRTIDPQRGRELLNEIWKTEAAPYRLRMIKILQTGLSMADEPFLEVALDDRSHLVRRQAAEILAHLTHSRLCRRMSQNAITYLSWTPQHETQISLRFPPVTTEMMRDGVVGLKSQDLARVRSRQLIQMVSAVPLDFWLEHWDVGITEIIRAIPTSRWKRTLTTAFSIAAQRQKNSAWAKAILQHLGFDVRTNRLIAILSADDCWQLIQQITAQDSTASTLTKDGPLYNMLRYWQRPLPPTLARFWLQAIAKHARHDKAPVKNVMLRSILLQFARNFPPSLAEEAADTLLPTIEANDAWRSSIYEIVRIMRFRWEMLAAIEQEPSA